MRPTDRATQDGAATGVALLIGVVLIGAGAAGLLATSPEPEPFEVAWVETPIADATATAALDGTPDSAEAVAPVENVFVSSVRITVPSCDDTFTADLQEPATLTWALTERLGPDGEGRQRNLDSKQFTCDEIPADGWRVEIADAGPVTVEAFDLEGAAEEADSLVNRTTATYTLTFTSERGGTALPLPVGQATLSATAALQVHEWSHTVRETEEVLR